MLSSWNFSPINTTDNHMDEIMRLALMKKDAEENQNECKLPPSGK